MKHLIRWCVGAFAALAIGFGAGQVMAPATLSATAGGSCPNQLCNNWGECVSGGLTEVLYCSFEVGSCTTKECGPGGGGECDVIGECDERPEGGGSTTF